METVQNKRVYNGLTMNEEEFMGEDLFMRLYNNCYTYAINQPKNPYTGEPYKNYSECQPFRLGGKTKEGEHDIEKFEDYIRYAKQDLNDIGLDIVPSSYEEYVEDERCWKVAFCWGEGFFDTDYHWYRQNDDGTWSHKRGINGISDVDDSDNIIYNPQECDRGMYENFVGFYMIKPLE